MGRAIFHSGTVGAALTAGVNGARGLAVSLDSPAGHRRSPRWADGTQSWPPDSSRSWLPAPAHTVLNLNVPELARDVRPPHRMATLAPFGIVQTTDDRARPSS